MNNWIITASIKPDPYQERILNTRFKAATCFYNAVLRETERRRRKLENSPEHKLALEKHHQGNKKEARVLFSDAEKKHGYYERSSKKNGKNNSIEQFGYQKVRLSWIEKHLDSATANKLSERAFKTSQKVHFKTSKKVCFHGRRFPLESVEGSSSKSAIKIKDWSLLWLGLKIDLKIDPNDELWNFLKDNNLNLGRVRILRRMVYGKWRWWCQIVVRDRHPIKSKYVLGKGKIGLDIGPSTIAVVGEKDVELKRFHELNSITEQIAKLQRKINHKRILSNPNNYNDNGTTKKGKLSWTISNRQRKYEKRLRELQRKYAETRKNNYREYINYLRSIADEVYVEDNQIKGWQRRRKQADGTTKKGFGKSIQHNAPALFVSMLKHRFESTGGKYNLVNCFKSRLSSTCICGIIKKKSLRERIHICECGFRMQRDLLSSLLLTCWDEEKSVVDVEKAKHLFWGIRPTLRTAIDDMIRSSTIIPSSFGRRNELEAVVRYLDGLPMDAPT